jgi:hypothetical protein
MSDREQLDFIPSHSPPDPDEQITRFFGGVGGALGSDRDTAHAAEAGRQSQTTELPYRSQLESSFGVDLGHVHSHSGAGASRACQALGAEAYASGNDVVFGSANPSLPVVAHEVAHTFQQAGNGPAVRRYGGVGAPGDSFEQQADMVAAAVVAGDRVDVGSLARGGAPGIQRRETGAPAGPAPIAPVAGPGQWNPPPEVLSGRIPGDSQVIDVGTEGLNQAMVDAIPFEVPKSERSWDGYAAFARLSSGDFVKNNLPNLTNGGGVTEILPTLTGAADTFTGSINITARVTNVTFESADGVPISDSGTGGPGTSGGGSYGSSASVSGQVGGTVAPVGGNVGGSAGDNSSRTSGGSWAGGSTRGSDATTGVRFRFSVQFTVSIYMDHEPRTWSAIVTLGTGYLAAGGRQNRSASATADGRVRFREARCSPAVTPAPAPIQPAPIAATPAQIAAAATAKDLQRRREESKDPKEQQRLARQMEKTIAGVRPDLEAQVRQIHPTLTAVDAAKNLYKVTYDGREYFGTLEVLLDFRPPSQQTLALNNTLTTQSGEVGGATITASGGLAGTSSQGRVNPFPGDVDLGETLRVEANSASAAGSALATSMQETVRRATAPRPDGTAILFLGMSAGEYPPGHPSAGRRISWTPEQVMAGQQTWVDRGGRTHTITLAYAFSHPGGSIVNTRWRGPIDERGTYGEITKVMTYEAVNPDTHHTLFATPSIGQSYQTVSFGAPQVHDTNRTHLIKELKPQIAQYFQEGKVLKACKRAYTVARMLNDIRALNDIGPLMGGQVAHLQQVTEHTSLFADEIAKPGGPGNAAYTAPAARTQAYNLSARVAAVDGNAGRTFQHAVDASPDVRANQVLYDTIEGQVIPPLETIIDGDAGYKARAGAVLRSHGYL